MTDLRPNVIKDAKRKINIAAIVVWIGFLLLFYSLPTRGQTSTETP